MSARVGSVKLGTSNSEPFLGRDIGHQRDYSEGMASTIDDEVRSLMDFAHHEAWEILNEYREVLDALVLELLERETLNEKELQEVFAAVVKRDPRPVWTADPDRPVSDIPPVDSPNEIASGKAGEIPQDQLAEANPEGPVGLGEVPDGGEVSDPAGGVHG